MQRKHQNELTQNHVYRCPIDGTKNYNYYTIYKAKKTFVTACITAVAKITNNN